VLSFLFSRRAKAKTFMEQGINETGQALCTYHA